MVGSHNALLGNAEMLVLWLEGQLYRCLDGERYLAFSSLEPDELWT